MAYSQLERMRYELAAMRVLVKAALLHRVITKYDPNQPRVPSGRPEGGQWTIVGGIQSGGKWNEGNRERCEDQYERDLLQCRVVLWNPACEDQALRRLAACMKGDPMPPFFHIGATP